jgi:hypothetical protein
MRHLYQSGILFLSVLVTTGLSAQITADNTISIDSLVNEIFNTGTFVEVSNVIFNGVPVDETLTNVQIGLFSNGFSDGLPIDSGFAMTTTNMVDAFTGEFGTPMSEEYIDADMELIAGNVVNDCAVLEFDVLNLADALAFTFTFASSEYQFYTCSVFNDAFGLLISGPGISGPYENGAINIATIPNSETPIAINTVNGGLPTGGGQAENCEAANPNWIEDSPYFIENYGNSISSIGFNGFTVSIEAIVEVEQNETYHLKFAFCDVVDGALDSGIILEANSFEGKFLSVFDQNRPEQLKLYPNPTTDQVFVEIPETYIGQNLNVRILDMQGRAVSATSLTANGTVALETSQLEKGLYLVETSTNGKVFGISKLLRD